MNLAGEHERSQMSTTPANPILFPPSLTYEQISAKHEDWDGSYLHRLRAFYKGGRALLGDDDLMSQVFPKQGREGNNVYGLRRRLAFYVNYAAEILNFIVASLSADRLSIKPADDGQGAAPLDEWYSDFINDVSPPGGKAICLHDFTRAAALEALITRVAWARIDMPERGEYQNLKDQEISGGRDAFAVLIPAECVIDWEEDDSGELLFCVIHTCESKRLGLASAREKVTEIFRVYTIAGWARYEITHDKGKATPKETKVACVASGEHSFRRVPIVRFDVGDGLWAMDNIEGACREHLNKRSALAWGERQSLLPELYEFLAPSEGAGVSEAQSNPNRATDMARGPGFIQRRGAQDDARFIGPSTEPFEMVRKSCAEIRDEIHRVTHQMALAADNSAAALKRSAESKGADKASAVVVFEALGQFCRKFAEDILAMVSTGRGDYPMADTWQATGMAKFDAISVDSFVQQAVELSTVTLHSPTASRIYELSLWKSLLGDEASEEEYGVISDELEENITAESMQPLPKVDVGGNSEEPKLGEEGSNPINIEQETGVE
jgi:hypothetical protein